MSYLDKLLDGVEVEWKTLGEIGEFVRGKRFVKTDILSEGIPCIRLVAVRIREMSSFRAKSKHGEFFIPQEQPRVAGDHRNGRAPVHDFVAAF